MNEDELSKALDAFFYKILLETVGKAITNIVDPDFVIRAKYNLPPICKN